VILRTGMPRLDLVPSNLTMSTIDLSLMPLARASSGCATCSRK